MGSGPSTLYKLQLNSNMAHLSHHPKKKKLNANLPCVSLSNRWQGSKTHALSVNQTYGLSSSGTKRLLGLLSARRHALAREGLRVIA